MEEIEVDGEEEQHRYLSYIVSEADNFEALHAKFFRLDEIANLLASSHHQHRLYALDLLTKMLVRGTQNDAKVILSTILHPDQS